MKERPILFSGPMARAILEGKKTQTRRAIKPQPCWKDGHGMVAAGWSWDISPKCKLEAWKENEIGKQMVKYCPYGAPGDRLWVRETWHPSNHYPPGTKADYLADTPCATGEGFWKWKPSIHMPRWASRITLEITDVRVERLQEISEGDAKAEGIKPRVLSFHGHGEEQAPLRPDYRDLWELINGKGSWDINPWVWVIGFKKTEGADHENG